MSPPSHDAVDAALADILLRTAAAGVAVLDRDYRYVRVNEALAAMNGLSAVAHVGRHIRDVLPPEGTRTLEPVLRRIMETGEPVRDLPVDVPMPDGTHRHFLTSYAPTFDPAGAVTGIVGVVIERTPTEAALLETEARLRRVWESGIVGLFLWGMDGQILEANDAFLQMLGYTQADLVEGRVNWRGMTPAEFAEADERALAELRATGRHGQVAKEYVARDGGRVPVIVTSALLAHDAERGVCVCVDASAERHAEAERERLFEAEREARERADEANRAKSDFLATMSHELRTPLNAIAGYADLLDLGVHGPLSEPQRDAIARIQRSQRHLLGLINDVLSFARIEAGHVDLAIGAIELDESIAAIETLIAPQLTRKGLVYIYEPCEPGVVAWADGEKVRQILLNLLSNAIKFTDPGGHITMWCALDPRSVRLSVTDTGRGIPSDKLEKIFEPFVQLDASATRAHEGTGLGLAISRDLARAMQGELTVRSEVGAGSTFTLVLKRP